MEKLDVIDKNDENEQMINSRFFKLIDCVESLRGYIKRKLGAPLIQIEITDEQIDEVIQETIDLYCEYAADGVEHLKISAQLTPGISQYRLNDRVKAVKNIYTTSSSTFSTFIPEGYGLSSYTTPLNQFGVYGQFDTSGFLLLNSIFQNISVYCSAPVAWEFNENTKMLDILTNIRDDIILLDLAMIYIPKEKDMIFNHPWIKAYSVAQTKFLWGQIIGKYSGNIIGGGSINYDRIISEAQQEKEQLKEELLNTYGEPLGVFVM